MLNPFLPIAKIFLLSPDHYTHGKSYITVADKPLQTPVAKSDNDPSTISHLINIQNVLLNNNIFSNEHGIGSVLPFVQVIWPKAKVIPIFVRADAHQEQVAELLQYL